MEDIPDLNIFMMCEAVNKAAYKGLKKGFKIRKLQPEELDIWLEFPFDTEKEKIEYRPFMENFYNQVYKAREGEFFDRCLVVVDSNNKPVGTCFAWLAYNKFWTIHWFKVLKSYEGQGLGRAILTEVMKTIPDNGYPVYLHTQPSSYRAIKLYSDFGFKIITDEFVGERENGIKESEKYLKHFMKNRFLGLKFTKSDGKFSNFVKKQDVIEF